MRPIYYVKQRRGSRRKYTVFFLFFGVLFILSYFLIKSFPAKSTSQHVLGKKQSEATPIPTPTSFPTPKNNPESSELLGQAVSSALVGTHGSYGVVVKNLKTGENYSQNEYTKYPSASLYKLWVMGTVYEQIKNGKLKENDILSEDVAILNKKFNIASQSAELTEGTITLSIKDALYKMVTISDNYAALLLASKVRLSNVADFLKRNGFKESAVGADGGIPTTTAYDTALFFEKLYNSQIIDKESSASMLQLLKWQRLNDKLPKYLPDNIVIAHKTGELDKYTHDGGIVYAENSEYIIVVLSKSDSPDLAENRISNISEAVYNYFQNK